MLELNGEQQQALTAQGETLNLIDPRTQRVYVLLPQEQYERLKNLPEPGPLTEEERRVILRGVWERANWDDPRMDDYEALLRDDP